MTHFSFRRLRNYKAIVKSENAVSSSETLPEVENNETGYDIQNQHGQSDQNSLNSPDHSQNETNVQIAYMQKIQAYTRNERQSIKHS